MYNFVELNVFLRKFGMYPSVMESLIIFILSDLNIKTLILRMVLTQLDPVRNERKA